MASDVETIPRIRRVIYDTYANLPLTGVSVGDLGYTTDRLILYRWSGAAWVAITIHSSSGIAANIPNAATLPNGSLYYETDTFILKQVQAGAWATITQSLAITSGTYTGDASGGRAIAHGLGRAPSLVFITISGHYGYRIIKGIARIHFATSTGPSFNGALAVTAPDATNFYVGNAANYEQSANVNTGAYAWVAIG